MSSKALLIVVAIVVAAAFAIHLFGGDLMSMLRSMHGAR
jgi:hypothetical protein